MSLYSVFCQAHRPDPKGEMQVNQTCYSELEFHNLSTPPLSLISSCLPLSILFKTKLLSSNGDNWRVIDFFVVSTGVTAAWVPCDMAIDS